MSTHSEKTPFQLAYREYASRDAAQERVNSALVTLRIEMLDLIRQRVPHSTTLINHSELHTAIETAKGQVREHYARQGIPMRHTKRTRITIDADADNRETARIALANMHSLSQQGVMRRLDDMAPPSPGLIGTSFNLRAYMPERETPSRVQLPENATQIDLALAAKLDDLFCLRELYGAFVYAASSHAGDHRNPVSSDIFDQIHRMIWTMRNKTAERAFMLGMICTSEDLRQRAISAYMGFYELNDNAHVAQLMTPMGTEVGRTSRETTEQMRQQMRDGIASLRARQTA